MVDTTVCKALRAFTEFVPGYGQVHGDPNSKDSKKPKIPNYVIDKLVAEDKIEKPRGWVTADDLKEAENQAIADALDKHRSLSNQLPYSEQDVESLKNLATERGIMPETGSGQNGAVLKADIVTALEQADADQAAADSAP